MVDFTVLSLDMSQASAFTEYPLTWDLPKNGLFGRRDRKKNFVAPLVIIHRVIDIPELPILKIKIYAPIRSNTV